MPITLIPPPSWAGDVDAKAESFMEDFELAHGERPSRIGGLTFSLPSLEADASADLLQDCGEAWEGWGLAPPPAICLQLSGATKATPDKVVAWGMRIKNIVLTQCSGGGGGGPLLHSGLPGRCR